MNPPSGDASHCIGVRQPSRPARSKGGSGSIDGSASTIPISSPAYRTATPRRREQQERRGARALRPPARCLARLVVVRERVGGDRAGRMERLRALDAQGQVAVVPRREEHLEVEDEVELVVGAVAEVAGQLLDRQVGLAHQHPAGELRRDAPQVADDVVHLGPVHAPQRVLPGLAAHARDRAGSPVGRVVAEQVVLDGGEDGVDPEAVDAAAGTRSASPRPSPRPRPGCASSGRAAPDRTSGGSTAQLAASHSQELPPKAASQFDGGPPSGAGSAQMYQSRLALSRDERLSTNHG